MSLRERNKAKNSSFFYCLTLLSGLSDMELAAYRTRSLPSWGKGNKQRPVSTTDDLEELYAKVSGGGGERKWDGNNWEFV